MTKRKLTTVILLLTLLFSGTSAQAAQVPVSIQVYYMPIHFVMDGKEMAPPEGQKGFIYEGSTYVPLRFISYSLNKAVGWDGATYTVTVQEPDDREKVAIKDYNLNRVVRTSQIAKVNPSQFAPTTLDVYFEKVTYIFDGKTKEPPVELPGMIYEGSLYVPMRFFSESVGKKIEWDPETYTIKASVESNVTKPATDKPKEEPVKVVPPAGGQTGGAPTAPTGGGPIGGGMPPTKPSYDSLKSMADGHIAALRDEAQNYFFGLLIQYQAATDDQAKAQIASNGRAQLSAYDSRFEAILSEFQSQLTANGYSTVIIAEYRTEYANQKALAQAFIGSN